MQDVTSETQAWQRAHHARLDLARAFDWGQGPFAFFVGATLQRTPGSADLGLSLGNGHARRPTGRRTCHLIHQVDLDVVWHPVERHVLSSAGLRRPVHVELPPCRVTLRADLRLAQAVTLLWGTNCVLLQIS
jgi:hypothetical protein